MTPGLLKSCYKQNNLYKKFLKDPSAENKSQFIRYRNRFRRVKDETITRYYSEKFTEYSNNIRKTRDLLKLLLSRERYQLPPCVFYDCDGQPLASTSEIAKSFNEYFSTIGTKLPKKITPGNTFYKQYLGDPVSQSMYLEDVTPKEIIQISRNLKQSHSSGYDQINPALAGLSIPRITQIIAALINCSFCSGIFPDDLKIAKVIPLHKSDSKENIANYRPISVLPYFSKYFEKTIYNRTISFLEKQKIYLFIL